MTAALKRLGRTGRGQAVVGVLLVAAYLFPIYWMVATSLTPSSDIGGASTPLFPTSPTLEAYGAALTPDLIRGMVNSLVIATGTLLLTFVTGAPAAYGLARMKLRMGPVVSVFLLAAQILPTITLALPFFVIASRVGLVNTYVGLILANTTLALPFAIIVLRPYFLSVPEEVVDAARVDGATKFGAFWRIALPLVRPGLITVGALAFVTAWGEFVFGLTMATTDPMQPATVVLNRYIGQFATRWNQLMAAATITAIPVIVLFVAMQRFVVSGLTAGATKD